MSHLRLWLLAARPRTLPAAVGEGTRRMLYFFKGAALHIAGQRVEGPAAIELLADAAVELLNGNEEASEFLLLQGRPIAEPVAQYGPFVMNTQEEVKQAVHDFQNGKFDG